MTGLHKSAAQAEGRDGWPILGETLPFLSDPAGFVAERSRRHGRVFRTRLFGKPTLVLLGAQANRFVLTEGMEFLRWREGWPPTFHALLGEEALFLQDGEGHRRRRNLLMPAFHTEAIAGYVSTIEARVREKVALWEKLGQFRWYDQFHALSFGVASALLLGAEPSDDAQRLNGLVDDWTSGLLALPIPLPWTTFGRALRARTELLRYAERAIANRQASPKNDALGLLVHGRDEQGEGLSLEELKSQALFLIAAGYATTTSTLTYLAFALAKHPEVFARARQEQRELVGDRPLDIETIKRMTYLDQVLTEVERRYPPVQFGLRAVAKPFSYEGFDVPKGWQVVFSISATHSDPEYYPDPERFDPERWAGGRSERNTFKLVGFGGGPRVCMGLMLARTQIKIVASHLLRGYTWDIDPNQDFREKLMPARRPNDGMRVHFRRDQKSDI